MTEAWAYGGAPPSSAAGGTVTLVEGVTFCISGRSGDIRPGGEQGLFYRDTRFLSEFVLTLDDQHLEPLTVHQMGPFAATFVARRPPRPGTADSTLLVVRRRYVGAGMREDITLRNLGREASVVRLSLRVDADFAGLFEVKESRAQERPGIVRVTEPGLLHLAHRVGDEGREVIVSGDAGAVSTTEKLTWKVVVPSRQEVTVSVQIAPVIDGVTTLGTYRPGQPVTASQPAEQLAQWKRLAPRVSTPDTNLTALLARSAEDVGMLRIFDAEHPDRVVIAAGAPWFMTIFGRDSLLTSWMLLPVDPSIALGTLKTLADMQGTKVDPVTEEQPGRILHEVRSGLDSEAALGGKNVYYGSIDATPLFVMLLGELRRWGLAREDVEDLLPHADRALEWIVNDGDRDGDGFIEYHRATDRGLLHQGWKDSFDAISFASGAMAEPSIALAEVQGYVYAAYLARAHFAREVQDEELARLWGERADQLKRRFNEAFWLPEKGYFAIALDADKRPVNALASNMGHCLWTGIVDEDKAASVVEHLMSPEMFTGFGIRTLATTMGAYNPVSYHNGSVWPHENALIAGGMMRYGFIEQAQRLALGMFDAASRMRGRLPELFCGFDRAEFGVPVPYPTSCAPQAWAAAAPLYLLRSLLRFDPWVPAGKVWCDPAVPERLLPLTVDGVHLGDARLGVEVNSDGWRLHGLPDSLELVRGARAPLTAQTDSHTEANR